MPVIDNLDSHCTKWMDTSSQHCREKWKSCRHCSVYASAVLEKTRKERNWFQVYWNGSKYRCRMGRREDKSRSRNFHAIITLPTHFFSILCKTQLYTLSVFFTENLYFSRKMFIIDFILVCCRKLYSEYYYDLWLIRYRCL